MSLDLEHAGDAVVLVDVQMHGLAYLFCGCSPVMQFLEQRRVEGGESFHAEWHRIGSVCIGFARRSLWPLSFNTVLRLDLPLIGNHVGFLCELYRRFLLVCLNGLAIFTPLMLTRCDVEDAGLSYWR